MPASDTVSLNPIKLNWYIFSYGHITGGIDWENNTYECIDGRDLAMQVLYYWAPVADSTIQLAESNVSTEDIAMLFDTSVSKKIPIYKGQRHVLAPIFISQTNEWHIAIVFLLDKSEESVGLYRRLNKLYSETMKKVVIIIKIASRDTIKFTRYEKVPQEIWRVGLFKMRVYHILLGIIPHLPSIKIIHRTTLKIHDQFAKFKVRKYE
jgi:hypothetical protein